MTVELANRQIRQPLVFFCFGPVLGFEDVRFVDFGLLPDGDFL